MNNNAPPDFYCKLGVGRMEYSGWITAGRAISVTKLQSILQLYPDLNARWLLLGRRTMQENAPPYRAKVLPICDERTSKQIQINLLNDNIKIINEYGLLKR